MGIVIQARTRRSSFIGWLCAAFSSPQAGSRWTRAENEILLEVKSKVKVLPKDSERHLLTGAPVQAQGLGLRA